METKIALEKPKIDLDFVEKGVIATCFKVMAEYMENKYYKALILKWIGNYGLKYKVWVYDRIGSINVDVDYLGFEATLCVRLAPIMLQLNDKILEPETLTEIITHTIISLYYETVSDIEDMSFTFLRTLLTGLYDMISGYRIEKGYWVSMEHLKNEDPKAYRILKDIDDLARKIRHEIRKRKSKAGSEWLRKMDNFQFKSSMMDNQEYQEYLNVIKKWGVY